MGLALKFSRSFPKPWNFCSQVLLDALDQQRRDGVHRSRDVRVEYVPTKVLGLLPRRRLLQKAVRRRVVRGWWRKLSLLREVCNNSSLIVVKIRILTLFVISRIALNYLFKNIFSLYLIKKIFKQVQVFQFFSS